MIGEGDSGSGWPYTGRMAAGEYVALDLELTGLKVGTAEIIEVGVVRCTPGEVLEEWTSLVRPYTMPDLRIQRMTGIAPAMLRDAPPFEEVIERIRELLDGATPIGHNVRFDLDHLGAAGVDVSRAAVDTLPIAQVLAPNAPSHRLGDLCGRYGFEVEGAHRALVDAEASRRLLLALLERWSGLSATQREQVAAADASMGLLSPLRPFMALADGAGLARASGRFGRRRRGPNGTTPRRTIPEPPPRIDLPDESLADLTRRAFESASEQQASGMERREEQLAMALDAARALDAGEQAAVEAGTGVGKSLAYLAPAALWAMREGMRVIVSTHTRNLQAQLSSGDFAQLRGMLDYVRPGLGAELRATVLKGRGNYLCRRALETALAWREPPSQSSPRMGGEVGSGNVDRAMLLARVSVWSEQADCGGDREALRLSRDFDEHWARLSAERVSCLNDGTDQVAMGACFLARAFDAAAGAHITVVNHAWLISNLEAAQQARLEAPDDADFVHLAESDAVIIDEAQFLEDAATNALRTSVNEAALSAALEGIHSGDRRRTATLARRVEDDLPTTAEELSQGAETAQAAVESAWEAYGRFLQSFADGDAVVFTGGMRAQPDWEQVESLTGAAGESLARLTGRLRKLARAVEGDSAGGASGDERRQIAEDARAAADTCEEAAEALQQAIEADPGRTVVWLERQRTRRRRDPDIVALDAAPIDIGAKLDSLIWSRCPRVVLTGATLTVDGEWDFLRGRLGLPEMLESRYDSPFDYERNGRIFVANDMPSVQGPTSEVAEAQANAILTLARAAGGRTLALFTAHGTMRRVADLVRGTLENDGISLAVQGPDGSPAQVVDDLRGNPRTVVFGVAALWTGIDVPGEALSQVIVCRLPFDRPNDPIQSARSEQYENAFAEHQVPTAVLKLRQGVGRLIRRSDDHGVIVVLDDRVATKRYGVRFRDAMPPAPYEEAPVQRIAAAVRSFLPPLPAE